MRDAKEIVTDVLGLEGDLSAGRNGFEVYCAERDSAIVELECDRADAYAFALALALLTWLHGSQEPDARAELDAWMRAGIAVTGATGDDGRVRVRQAEEGECVVGYTFVDDAADFNPLTPEESAAINANSRAISAGPVNISAAFFQRPKAKP